jgi:hypothetical protein
MKLKVKKKKIKSGSCDLHTESDKPKEFKSGAVVNESHKQSSPCSSKDRGSLESKGHTNKQHNETTN